MTYDVQDRYYARLIYDLSFKCVVKISILNIIFGIIVDTFATLREEKNNIQHDFENNCYVCGVEKTDFDRFGLGFKNHIKDDHYL